MIFIAIYTLFLLHEVCGIPLYRIPKEKFANISQEAFKNLHWKTWKGGELLKRQYHNYQWSFEFDPLTKKIKIYRDPTEFDLNSTKLKGLLSDEFEPQFMAETEPTRAWYDSEEKRRHEYEALKSDGGINESITKLLTRKRLHLNEEEFEEIRFRIWNFTRCAVEPLWEDFGVRIWPRYVNVGQCSSKATCSLPSGMKCLPSEERTVKLLYWICPVKSLKSRRRCFWSSFEAKIIRACSCSC